MHFPFLFVKWKNQNFEYQTTIATRYKKFSAMFRNEASWF